MVHDEGHETLYVFDDYRDVAAEDRSPGFIAQVARATGARYVEGLDSPERISCRPAAPLFPDLPGAFYAVIGSPSLRPK